MTTTPAPSQIAALATDVIGQIKADLHAGYLPTIVKIPDFSALHNFVDANEYLITALDNASIEHDAASEEQAALLNRTMDFVNVWLAAR